MHFQSSFILCTEHTSRTNVIALLNFRWFQAIIMSPNSHNRIFIQLVILIQVWSSLPYTSSEFCDAHRNIQRVACVAGEGCVHAVKTSSSWVQGASVCACHGLGFADISPKMQKAIDAAPQNLQENMWISGSKTIIHPCGFVKGLTLAVDIVCRAFESGVFLWLVQAFYTQRHRGDPAIPICRRVGCIPHNVRFCIHFGNRTTTDWYDARNQCLEDGGDLFYLTQADNDNFLEFMRTFINIIQTTQQIGSPVYWAGIRYEDWYWQGVGDVQRTNWGPGEPSREANHECISMDMKTRKWQALPCGQNLGILCRDNVTITTTESTATTTLPTTIVTVTMPENATTLEEMTTAGATTAVVTDDMTTVSVATTTEEEEDPNATAVKTGSFCNQNKGMCAAVPAVIVIIVVALLVIAIVVVVRMRRRKPAPQEKPLPSYPISVPHTVEGDNNFNGLRDGARAAENIYVDPIKGPLKEDEGIYHEIGKKGYDEDGHYDDVGSIKKPPLDDDSDDDDPKKHKFSYAKQVDFDSDDDLKKPKFNQAFEFEEDLKKRKY